MIGYWAAGGFLVLSVLLIFGPPLVVKGRYAFEDLKSRPEPRLFAGFLSSVAIGLFGVVFAHEPLISGGEKVLTVADQLLGLRWFG